MVARKLNFKIGKCPFPKCGREGITARHYNSAHQIRVGQYLSRAGRLWCCAKCYGERFKGNAHESIAHLVAVHPEQFPQESRDNNEAVSLQAAQADVSELTEVDPDQAFANATVGGVFEYLLDRRRAAEAEAARLIGEANTLGDELRQVTERNVKLELDVAELTDSRNKLAQEKSQVVSENSALKEELTRVLRDNKAMNAEMFRFRNGVKSAAEFREVHGELQGRRT